MADDMLLEDHRSEQPHHAKSIFERVLGDFASGFAEATRLMKRYLRVKADQDMTKAAWDAEIADLKQQIEDLERARDYAASRYDWDLQQATYLLDGFRTDFAAHLPDKLTGFECPAGLFSRRKNREKVAREKDEVAMEALRRLPFEAQEQAIKLEPAVNWKWVESHLEQSERGPVLRWVNEETGEVSEVPATVEKAVPAGDVALVPIWRKVPPATPYDITITPARAYKGDATDDDSSD